MPVLELTTIGRKSGRPRSVMLPSPVQEGETWVIVASRGGNDHHPAWFLNLRDRPDVEVSRKGKPRQSMRARIATPDERARLWPRVTATYNGYAGYQEKTDREIPLVWLEPRELTRRADLRLDPPVRRRVSPDGGRGLVDRRVARRRRLAR